MEPAPLNDLNKKTLPELKQLCKAKGFKSTGNKSQLLARLCEEQQPVAPPQTPKRKQKKKQDASSVAELASPEEQSSPLDKAQAISDALAKALKSIQNYIWTKGVEDVGDSQEQATETTMDEENHKSDGDVVAQYLKEHENLFMALSRDCVESFDGAHPEQAVVVVQTFSKILEAIERNLQKLSNLQLDCDIERYTQEVCVAVGGNREIPRVLPFNEAMTFAWYLLGLCVAMLDDCHPLVSSLLNAIDNHGIDPIKCHADYEQEYGFLVSETAWRKLVYQFENKEEWKVATKKRKSKKNCAADIAAA